MTDVRYPSDAGQVAQRRQPVDPNDAAALEAWRTEARSIIDGMRLLAFDAASPRGQRRYCRRHLRNMIRLHLRALAARIAAIEPASQAPAAASSPT